MTIRRSHLGVAIAALLLAGCSSTGSPADSVWSALSGEDNSGSSGTSASTGSTVTVIPPSAAESNPQPTLSAALPAATSPVYQTPAPVAGSPTGTYVGAKVQSLRGDLRRLQDNINRHNADLQQIRQKMARDAANYYSMVGTINSRLQLGTTPGNPELVAQWNQSQGALDRMSDDIAQLNSLSNQTASDSSLAAYILDSVKAAYGLQGAVDEDHRQLSQLQSDVNGTLVLIDRLLNSISEDISRQSTYVSSERNNLVTLSLAIKNGELYGQSLSNRTFGMATPDAMAAAAPAAAAPTRVAPARGVHTADRRPLVIIRFDRPNVPYETALYSAVRQALDRRPDATFELVAVAPNGGSPAQVALQTDASKHNAENVLRSLTNMGLPATRISLSATTSASIQDNEVQLYVR
jgi:hypothetical protein